jgi:hypothetical protein
MLPHLRSLGRRGGLPAAALLALTLAACGETQKQSVNGPVLGSNIPAAPNVDRSKCDDKGKQVVTADTNQDQKPDVWKFFQNTQQNGQQVQVLACKQVDLNHDGRIDIVYYYDDKGAQTTLEEFDLDFDGKFDMTVYYVNGKKVREEFDSNYDQRPDLWKYFEEEKLVRVERDTNNDGKVDEWQYYEGGKLDRIGYDTTGSGRVDRWDRAPENEEGPPGSEPAGGGGGAGTTAAPGAPSGAVPAAATSPAPAAAGAKPAPKAAPKK